MSFVSGVGNDTFTAPMAALGMCSDNSPAIHGWVKGHPKVKVPRGTAEWFFRP
jgi:hypothetical protein